MLTVGRTLFLFRSRHFNPGVSVRKQREDERLPSQASDFTFFHLFIVYPFFYFMHKIPAVLHFTPNFTFNFLMNSYPASFCFQTSCIHFFIYQHVHKVSHE